LATYHGVAGLLLYWMKKLKLETNIPRDVHRNLHGIHESQAHFLEDHQEIIRKILMRFYESETEVILLKGAQLGHTEYPHFTLRPIEDIDLLIRRPDRSRVIKFMLAMGFNLYETNQTCDKFFIRKKQAGKPIFIEIHSNLQTPIRLNRSFNIDIDKFWKDTQEMNSNGFSFLQLCPTYNLIYLGAHLSHHYFSRLIWVYDIALLIHRHREEIDWKKLEGLCGRMKIRSPLFHSLTLCRDFFQTPPPEKVLKGLSSFWGRRKVGQFLIRRNLWPPEKSRMSRFGQFLIKTFLVDSWMEAILWFLFPTREWMKKAYSLQRTHKVYPYYLLHPVLYLIKSIKTQ
ncbi:MAG: nucleotidyltransferase family protein, partial [Deltaproteobacteria bacterium]|nr:nucleotidyltransferase family protein [Deltaproteobacteria bacterium]